MCESRVNETQNREGLTGKGEKLTTDGKGYPNVLHGSAHSVDAGIPISA